MTAPDEFIPWDRPSPLLDRIGDLRRHYQHGRTFGFVVDEPKLNARGIMHAGAIATIADVCIGHSLAAETDPPTSLVTINLNTNFVGTASTDDWVDVSVQVHRVGGRIASGSAEFRSGYRVIAHASGIFLRADR
ncbi:MAG: PaaI family thioesterase, partial [Acidimicrobiaceae bacterium]|nr:PaaI family thioesterase [Acidimicrobiaceae bacterium]